MELTDAMIEEIRKGARLVEYGKVTIEIETRGNEPSLDIVTTARRRFQKAMPENGVTKAAATVTE
jgi:hypothetical protein